MTLNSISEQELRDLIKEGKTLYQISRQFNTTIPEIFKLGRSYGISFAYDHNHIPYPNKQDLESMYNGEHLTQEQISREFNVIKATVGTWLRNHKIPTRGSNGTLAVPMPPKEVLERMYIDERMTQKQIAKEFDVSQGTVGEWLRYHNISTVGRPGSLIPIPPKNDLLNYIAEGLNQNQIAEKCKVSDWKICDWCEYYRIPGMFSNFRCTTTEHINWRDKVFARDNYICQECGSQYDLQAHHIVPFADHPEVAYELENGITLCKQCHESIRGREYEYLDQFAAITQPHLRDHEVIESMPWEPPLPPLQPNLFPDYSQEVIA